MSTLQNAVATDRSEIRNAHLRAMDTAHATCGPQQRPMGQRRTRPLFAARERNKVRGEHTRRSGWAWGRCALHSRHQPRLPTSSRAWPFGPDRVMPANQYSVKKHHTPLVAGTDQIVRADTAPGGGQKVLVLLFRSGGGPKIGSPAVRNAQAPGRRRGVKISKHCQ